MAQPEFSSIRLVTPADQASFDARNRGGDASRNSGRQPRGLADLLLARGHINQDELAAALALERHQDLGLADLLLARGLIREEDLLNLQTEFHRTRQISLNQCAD